jgi:DNA mismatch repair protein MutS2
MIYPENIEKKIGFDVIRQQLIGYCFSELGRKLIEELSFETDLDIIELQLERVNDLWELVATGEIPPISATVDLSAYLARSLVKDNWLNADELYYIYASITTSLGLKDFISVAGKEYSSLTSLVPELVNLSALEVQLVKSIDEDGNVLSSASSELKNIRGKILDEEGSLRNTLSSIFRKASVDGFVPDGASIGVRDGRMVIPIIASHKRKIQGSY